MADLIYKYLYDQLYEKKDALGYLNLDEARLVFTKYHNIPKSIANLIIKEMELMGLFRRVDMNIVKLKMIKESFKVNDNLNKISIKLGIF